MKRFKEEIMENNKTIKEKIEKSAIAAMGISAILALFTAIGIMANILDTVFCQESLRTANCIGNTAESVLLCAVSIISMLLFAKISKDGTPFSPKIVMLLRAAGFVMMLYSFIPPAARGIALSVLGEVPEFSGNMPAVFFGAILMILAQIFNYGTMLQQESDETL